MLLFYIKINQFLFNINMCITVYDTIYNNNEQHVRKRI